MPLYNCIYINTWSFIKITTMLPIQRVFDAFEDSPWYGH